MKKRWRLAFTAIICCFFTGLLLCACGNNGTPQTNKPNDTNTDPFYTEGFMKGTVQTDKVYKDLLSSVGRPFDAVSSSNTMRYVNSEVEAELRLNEVDVKLNYKVYYDKNQPSTQKSMFSLTKAGGRNIFSLTFFAGELSDILYMAVGTGLQVSVPLPEENFFRLTSESSGYSLELYSNVFSSLLIPKNNEIKYEYKKENSSQIRHYFIDLDMKATLQEFVKFARKQSEDIQMMVEYLFDALLGITPDEIMAGQIPNFGMSIDFTTSGGAEGVFGTGDLDHLKIEVTVPDVPQGNTAILLREKTELEISKYTVLSTPNSSIPSRNSFLGYRDYREGAYRLETEVLQKGVPMKLLVDMKFSEDHTKMGAYARLINETGGKEMEVSYIDGKLHTYLYLGKGDSLQFELEIDLVAVIDDAMKAILQTEKSGAITTLIYVLGNFTTLSDGALLVNLNNGLFRYLLGIDSYAFIALMQEHVPDDVDVFAILRDGGWREGLEYSFTLKLNFNKDMIYRISEIETPNQL